uniref:uncharacterized protein LOC120330782 isoform X1 n=1 Tax=Styela clava TaxID=7725 RepID=UPI00193A9C90|nr:uncharacterized protein LOC120330782 isoform X1 [Styela clava]
MASNQNEASRIYEVVRAVKRSEWPQIAKIKLGLKEVEIEECECNYQMQGMIEQRYQMVLTWQRKKGRIATVDLLEQLMEYRDERPPQRAHQPQEVRLAQQGSSVVGVPSWDPPPLSSDAHGSSRNSGDAPPLSSDAQGSSRNEQSVNVPLGSAPVPRNSASNVTSGDTDRMPLNGDVYDGSSNSDKIGPKGRFSHKAVAPLFSSLKINLKGKNATGIENNFYSGVDPNSIPPSLFGDVTIEVEGKNATSVRNNFNLKQPITEIGKEKSPLLEEPLEYCSRVNENFEVTLSSKKDYDQQANEIYQITKEKGRLAVIISCTFSETDEERHGAERDAENHKIYFEKIGFKVLVLKEKTSDELLKTLKNITRMSDPLSCLVIVVLSHGNEKDGEDIFFSGDCKSIKVSEVLTVFNNLNAKMLQGVPKVFVFTFCRGKNIDWGVEKLDRSIKDCVFGKDNESTSTQGASKRPEKIPTISDTIILYGSQPGFVGHQNAINGNYHSNAFINVFRIHAHDRDVAEMSAIINNAMKKKTGKGKKTDGEKQMSGFTSTLSKKLFLFPSSQSPSNRTMAL